MSNYRKQVIPFQSRCHDNNDDVMRSISLDANKSFARKSLQIHFHEIKLSLLNEQFRFVYFDVCEWNLGLWVFVGKWVQINFCECFPAK